MKIFDKSNAKHEHCYSLQKKNSSKKRAELVQESDSDSNYSEPDDDDDDSDYEGVD